MFRKKVKVKVVKLKLMKDVRHLPIWQLLVFVLVFASIGSYFTFRSFAFLAGDPPTAPSHLTASAVNSSEIQISWGASSSESVSTLYYSIYRNNALVTTTTALTYYNSGLAGSTTYTYFVTAHDQFGTSPASNSVSITTPAPPPPPPPPTPAAPTGFTAHAVSTSEIDLSWNASANATGYMIFRNTGQINTTTSTTYHDTGLPASTTYSYYVVAYDQTAAYASSPSNTASATTLASATQPTAPGNLTAKAVSPSQINLSWNPSTGRYGITDYVIYRNGSEVADINTTAWSNTGLSASTTYSYYVIAFDTIGANSTPSNTATATTLAPPPPPTAPSGLSAEILDDQEIDLSWNASTSSTGIDHYNIYRNSTFIGSTSSTTLSDTGSSTAYYDNGLASATTYLYYVVAVNNSGVGSSSSGSVYAQTQSTTPPSAPTSFKAMVTSASTVSLSWTASTLGQVGIKEYDIYEVTPPDDTDDNGQLDGQFIASTTSTGYQVTGLNASTDYGFYVIAVDTTGNFSDQSAEGLATTNAVGYAINVGLSASVTEIGAGQTGTVINWSVVPNIACTKKFDSDGSASDPSWKGSFSGLAGGSQVVYPPSASQFYTFYSYELSCTNGASTAVSGMAVRKFSDDVSN